MSSAMAALGVSLGPRTPETLIEEVTRLPGVVRELELSTARCAVHRVLAMFESHYQGLDRTVLSGGWAPGVSDEQCDELEEDCAAFAREMADAARVARLFILCYPPITSERPRTTATTHSRT
jgi:hypothetical protein